MATVLADGVHLGVDWQRKLYVSKIDLLIGPCPLAPALFFPVSMNGIPILPGVQVKGLGVTSYWARPHMHTAKLQANPVGSLFQTYAEGDQVLLPPPPLSWPSQLLGGSESCMMSPLWPACPPAPTHCTVVTLISVWIL